MQLNTTLSPISRDERNKINENWQRIIAECSRLQAQINILSGDVSVEEILQALEDAIANANTTVAALEQQVQQSIADNDTATQQAIDNLNSQLQTALNTISTKLTELETAITNAETATTNANTATSEAQSATTNALSAIADMQNFVSELGFIGVYDSTVTYDKNNMVRYQKAVYIALVDGLTGITPSDDGVNWRLVIRDGVDGTGAVSTVNNVPPDENRNVSLTPSDIGAASSTDLSNLQTEVTEHLAEYATTSDVTYYVNGATGNDNNNGLTSTTAFATIGKVLSLLPQIINHKVTIEIAAGTYNEDLKIRGKIGRGDIIINGATSLTNTHNVKSVEIDQCLLEIILRGINSTNTTGDSFIISRCNSVYLQYCKSNTGFLFADTKASIRNSEGNNSLNGGISLIENSSVLSENNTGTNNNMPVLVSASALYVVGTLPDGNNNSFEQSGGFITTNLARKNQELWIPAVLENGWMPFEVTDNVGYYKDAFDIVRLRGRIKSGTVGTVAIFTLPIGYRIGQHAIYTTNDGSQIYVLPDGKVCMYYGTNAGAWLDGITFRAEG